MSAEPLTFEKVWLMFQEAKEIMEQRSRETDRKFQETDKKFQEAKEIMEQRSRETDRIFRQTDKKLKKLENLFTGQWGKLMESLVEGDLVPLLNQHGIPVNETMRRQVRNYNGYDFEIDIIARNGREVVFVEVKTTLTPKHVKNYLEKLKIVQTVFPSYRDNTIYGAMAYLRSEAEAHTMAMKKGLFAIQATGKSATIVNNETFQPTNFGV